MAAQEELSELLEGIKNYKTRIYCKHFGTPLSELYADEITALIIAANEKNLNSGAPRDDIEKFENMTLSELNDFLGLADEAEDEG